MLLVDVTFTFSDLLALFTAMGRVFHAPFAWIVNDLVPVHKKGLEAVERNNKPLGILSTIPQVYERVVTTLVRKLITHCLSQMGFLSEIRSEMALARVI